LALNFPSSPVDGQLYVDVVSGFKHSEETRRKIGEMEKGNQYRKGKTHTNKVKKRLSEVNTGKVLSIETRKKMSESKKGRVVSVETRKKIGEANKIKLKGRTVSEEVRKKISNTMLSKSKRKINVT